MYRFIIFSLLVLAVFSEEVEEEGENDDNYRVVDLGIGSVSGEKYWNGDFYEFYGIQYARAPTGRDRFKAPLPVEPWEGVKPANARSIYCQQFYLTEEEDEEIIMDGVEECLYLNVFVPKIANENNRVPVLVYIHSGAFAGGSSNMGKFHYLARHDVVVVSFNYRLGAVGFACLGTEDIPGNAGLKDQLAALRWINQHISKFGGDPDKVTLAGFSVGASMAEILALSKAAGPLINKLILESGSALSPFAVNRDPIHTARNLAISIGFNDTGNLKDLNEFLLEVPIERLVEKSKNFFLTNSTFGLAPCIEKVIDNIEPVLTESPLDTLTKGDYKPIPVLTGFSNMEGISRTIKFGEWREEMNDNFADFLPADLVFDTTKSRDDFIASIKRHYFKDQEVSANTLQEYIDYFSDSMFKYAIMKSVKLHAAKRPIYVYEFRYVGKLNMKHYYMDKVEGASHRDQTAYILDFYDHTTKLKDMDTRDRLTTMWTDFVIHENPTAYENLLINVKWLKYTNEDPNYLEIGYKLKMKKDLFTKRYEFWDRVYRKYYWNPRPVDTKAKNKF